MLKFEKKQQQVQLAIYINKNRTKYQIMWHFLIMKDDVTIVPALLVVLGTSGSWIDLRYYQ